jgi:sec-independent protein translocase protein TatA
MGGASIWHWIVVGLMVMLLFGRGKISEMMGDVAKGIKAFKKGMSDEDAPETATTTVTPVQPTSEPIRNIEHQSTTAAAPATAATERKLG